MTQSAHSGSSNPTHQVFNQPGDVMPRDLWHADIALREVVERYAGNDFSAPLAAYGQVAGTFVYDKSFDAHRDRPRLRTHDRFGNRIDVVEFHPNYHAIMAAAIAHGVAGLSWRCDMPGAHVARAALSYLHYQVEPGSSCPLTMTHAAVPVLRREPRLRAWADKATQPHYDGGNTPMMDKRGVTIGMGMTEKQGGSDVRANTTRAAAVSGSDGEYALRGHKWFFSAPMSDAFLVTAQTDVGLTCFLVPRWRDDGRRNDFSLMRLKDKLGDWSNASSEVEFNLAQAWRIGDEGKGVSTIIEMVMLTRLDCMLGSAALMRMALLQALHHCRYRQVFGMLLADQPLMRNVLADIALEVQAATALAFRVAAAVGHAAMDPDEAAFARVATAIGKYWICRRAPMVVNEAQECLGGAGYVEESLLPRLYRQAPLNGIWEGSGNVQCLDVLRALHREPAVAAALRKQLLLACGRDADYDAACDDALAMLDAGVDESQARRLVEMLGLVLQAAVLLQAAHPAAELFCANRLHRQRGLALGTLRSAQSKHGDIQQLLLARVFSP